MKKYLSTVLLGSFLQSSAENQVLDALQSEVLAHGSAEEAGVGHMSQRRRLSETYDCEFCGPPFGPASGDLTAYFPPEPYKSRRSIAVGSINNDWSCNDLEGEQATACKSLQQAYGYANLAWFQSTDPEKDHTVASVISSIGYPSAVQFSVGSSSNVTLNVDFVKANSSEKWITVNTAASVTGLAFMSLVEFVDKNGDHIFQDGEEVNRVDLNSQLWNAPGSATNTYAEGNEVSHSHSVSYATTQVGSDGDAFVFRFTTSDYEVVVNDQTLDGDRVKVDVELGYQQTVAGSFVAIETAVATTKFSSSRGPVSTIASSLNGEDGFVDWTTLANQAANVQSNFLRVVAGEFTDLAVADLQPGAFKGLIQQFESGIELKRGYLTFVDDAKFVESDQKCSGSNVSPDPAAAHNARACHMNCAATDGCKVYSFGGANGTTPSCVFGFSGDVQCSSASGYESGTRQARSSAMNRVTVYWDPALTYEKGGYIPIGTGIELDKELMEVMIMLGVMTFVGAVLLLVLKFRSTKKAQQEALSGRGTGANGSYGATKQQQI